MAIDTESARLLLSCKLAGVNFSSCATLGRQNYYLGRKEALKLLGEFGIKETDHPQFMSSFGSRLADDFFGMLGARGLVTIDASGYEGANCIHDMNQPIPKEMENRFDAVCDVGTLEHIFNFPIAIRNCLEMVRPGGHLLIHTTANNYFGHGFYQFSPELFFRVLSPANGFHMERMIAVELGHRRKWYDVADPESVQSRVTLTNSFPVMLFIRAKKLAAIPLFSKPVQQSDYCSQWQNQNPYSESASSFRRFARRVLEASPETAGFMESLFARLIQTHTFRNRRSFTRLSNKR